MSSYLPNIFFLRTAVVSLNLHFLIVTDRTGFIVLYVKDTIVDLFIIKNSILYFLHLIK